MTPIKNTSVDISAKSKTLWNQQAKLRIELDLLAPLHQRPRKKSILLIGRRERANRCLHALPLVERIRIQAFFYSARHDERPPRLRFEIFTHLRRDACASLCIDDVGVASFK